MPELSVTAKAENLMPNSQKNNAKKVPNYQAKIFTEFL